MRRHDECFPEECNGNFVSQAVRSLDIGEEMIELVLSKGHFRANGTVFNTATELLDVLLGLGRR